MVSQSQENSSWVEEIIRDFIDKSPENDLRMDHREKAWDAPLVGFARGDDPYFDRFKADLGPFYWTPEEIFNATFPDQRTSADELSVVCYVLPQTEATRNEQRKAERLPAERWSRSRDYGEKFNCTLRLHLAAELTRAGYPAVAPERDPDFAYRQSERFGLASNWSERHAAFVAGLGTFGLSDGLITERGKAVRIGSVVTRLDLPATPRSYGEAYQAWCLWHARGTCGACAGRCPVDAISKEEGHDKEQCRIFIRDVTTPYVTEQFGTADATPCGLCQVRIPCESGIPSALK